MQFVRDPGSRDHCRIITVLQELNGVVGKYSFPYVTPKTIYKTRIPGV